MSRYGDYLLELEGSTQSRLEDHARPFANAVGWGYAIVSIGLAAATAGNLLVFAAAAAAMVAASLTVVRVVLLYAIQGVTARRHLKAYDDLRRKHKAKAYDDLYADDHRRGRTFSDVPKAAQWPDVTQLPPADANQAVWYAYARALNVADLKAALSQAPALRAERLDEEGRRAIDDYEAHLSAHATSAPVEWIRREVELRARLPHGYRKGLQ